MTTAVTLRSVPKGKISGQVSVPTAGSPIQGPDVATINGFYVKALPGNTGLIYAGDDGTGSVSSSSGLVLSSGDSAYFNVQNLSQLWFDSSVNGEGIAWIKG